MDVLREQIQKLRPEEQEKVFALLLSENVPFHRSNDAVMVMLSKASDTCIRNIQSFLRDIQMTSSTNSLPKPMVAMTKRPSQAVPESQIVKDSTKPGVHFDHRVSGDNSDGESPERKLVFSSAQAAVRKRIKSTQKRNVRLRKSSSKRDYGERWEYDTEAGNGDVKDADEAGDEEAEPGSEIAPDAIDFDGDVDETADDAKSVDGTYEDDDVSALEDYEEKILLDDPREDIKEDPREDIQEGLSSVAIAFNYGSSTVAERFTYYVGVLEANGFEFGDLEGNGYPSPTRHTEAEDGPEN